MNLYVVEPLFNSESNLLFISMKQRITIAEVLENDWFRKGYKAPTFENDEINLDNNIDDIFNESEVAQVVLLASFYTC